MIGRVGLIVLAVAAAGCGAQSGLHVENDGRTVHVVTPPRSSNATTTKARLPRRVTARIDLGGMPVLGLRRFGLSRSSALIKRGMDVFTARKITLLICAACTVPVFLAPQVDSMWTAVVLIGIAMAAHQGFSANLFTLVSDTMPRGAIASTVGLGGGIRSIPGAFSAAAVGSATFIVAYCCACSAESPGSAARRNATRRWIVFSCTATPST